jgi:hypothetical protein
LLVHADGTDASTVFRDDNGALANRTPVGLSAIGNAQISTAQSKFGGASALFDDSGDYLVSPTVSAGNFSGDFTVECWLYTSDTEGEFLACQKFNTAQGWGFITRSNNRLIWTSSTNGTSCAATIISSNNAYANNTWTHIAVCHKNSTGLSEMFANGVRVGSVTEQNPITVTSGGGIYIGGNIYGVSSGFYSDGPRFLNGYLDEIRFSNIVRYSGATYTIPTAPFQNDANTQFLLHCDGANASTQFFDDTGNRTQKGISAIGNAQVDTAQSKFGGASALFDGTGDYLTLGAGSVTPDLALTGNFWTVEYWARITSHIGAFQATVAIWNDQTGNGNIYYFSTNIYNGTSKMGFQYFYGTESDS